MVKIPETGEEFIDDKLTDIELKLLTGMYIASTSMYFITNWSLTFLIFFILKISKVNRLRCHGIPQLSSMRSLAGTEETEFTLMCNHHREEGSSNANGEI